MSKAKRQALYIGWDGSWVVATSRLRKTLDKHNNTYYLAPPPGEQCVDIPEAGLVFGWLGLKKYEVACVDVRVMPGATKTRTVRK